MNKFIINITDFNKLHSYNVELFDEIEAKYGVKTLTFFLLKSIPEDIITTKNDYFTAEGDLILRIKELAKDNEIIFINTFSETLIPLVNNINKILELPVSDNSEMFRDKSIQRELLLSYDKEITVNYKTFDFKEVNYSDIEAEFEYPFVIKPTSGLQSSGVMIINSREDLLDYIKNIPDLFASTDRRNLGISEFIIEEFIDGEMYSIDYFVDSEGKINTSNVVKVGLGEDLKIKDFMNYSRYITENTDKEIEQTRLNKFIEKNVKATGLKNTFVHHEFKLTSKNKLKTIELNGRIGGFRPYLYNLSYGLNLFELIFTDLDKEIKTNSVAILIYPNRKGILESYNEDLIDDVRALKSFHKDTYYFKLIGKEVGLTSDGYGKLGVIWLENTDLNQFNQDFQFIKDNFFNFVTLKKEG